MTEHRALCGWLLKQDGQSLWRGWKRRWFQQLHDYHLYYFTTCTTDINLSKGFIDIKLVVNVQADTASKEKHVFNVMTADRTYVLQATSEDEVNYWITGLNAIISNLSQPLATLINKAELFEKQQQLLQEQRRTMAVTPTKSRVSEEDFKTRHMSMRFPDMATAEKGEKLTRSNSMRNITYIDYADTPPPTPLHTHDSVSAPTTPKHAPSPAPALAPAPAPASASVATPVQAMPLPTTSAPSPSPSPAPSPKMSAMLEVEKEQMENKKRASMRDLQALIVREKDAEIARLTMEVVRLTEIQEQASQATKEVRQQYQQQFDQLRVDEHLRYTDMERKLTEQLDEANYNLRKRDEECTRAQEAVRVASEESERARVELTQIKLVMEQKITILESEINLKENIISQLNSRITSINGELSAKDSLLENSMREIPYATAFDDVLLVAQLEKERETRHALQEQCAFLGQEVFKLETELKHQRILVVEQKNKILERSSAAGTSPNSRSYFDSATNNSSNINHNNNGNGSMSGNFNSVGEDNVQLKLLAMENKDLRQKYFMSVGRSLKLQTTMNGGYINISVADLYEQALHRNIKIEEWPNWISDNLANSFLNASK